MKNLFLTLLTLLTLNLSAQIKTDTTKKVIFIDYEFYKYNNDQINLRLDGLEKFGKQHRTGNHLIIAGTLLNGFGLLFMNNTTAPANPGSKLTDDKLATGTLLIGSLLTTTGLIINIDSYRHLKRNNNIESSGY
jgi:hypothetical protein